MKWDCHIYDPKTQATTTHVCEVPRTRSMADSAQAVYEASKKFGVKQMYILCVPHRQHQQSASSWCVTWINPTTKKRQVYFDELPERAAEIEARTLRMHHPNADVRKERC